MIFVAHSFSHRLLRRCLEREGSPDLPKTIIWDMVRLPPPPPYWIRQWHPNIIFYPNSGNVRLRHFGWRRVKFCPSHWLIVVLTTVLHYRASMWQQIATAIVATARIAACHGWFNRIRHVASVCTLIWNMVACRAYVSQLHKRHLDQFRGFCRAHDGRDQHTDTHTCPQCDFR